MIRTGIAVTSAILCLTLLFGLGRRVCLGEIDDSPRAMSEEFVDAQVARKPEDHATRIIAGFLHFDAARFAKAEQQFAKAVSLRPDDPYDRAWLYMAQLRQNPKAPDATIRAFVKRTASKEFIYTDIAVLLGVITPDQGAEIAAASKDLGNLCEAHYYAAQRLLANDSVDAARKHLNDAVNTKQKDFWEYKSASAWLKVLSTMK